MIPKINLQHTHILPPKLYCRLLTLLPNNRPFHRYGGHIEFIRFKEYYGMPREHSLSIYECFLG